MAEGDSDSENNFTFHYNHGTLVQLSENRLTAFRQRPSHEFNQGLVFSHKPLKDDEVFEIRIDRKVRRGYSENITSHSISYCKFVVSNGILGTVMDWKFADWSGYS